MRRLLLVIAACSVLVVPASASGSVTVGSTLAASPNGTGCFFVSLGTHGCTLANAPATSPIGGVIVRWRIKTDGARAFTARPRVLSGTTGVASGDSITVPAAADTVKTENTHVKIAAGQTFGVDVE